MGLWGQIFRPTERQRPRLFWGTMTVALGRFKGVKIFFCFLFKTTSQRGASDTLTQRASNRSVNHSPHPTLAPPGRRERLSLTNFLSTTSQN